MFTHRFAAMWMQCDAIHVNVTTYIVVVGCWRRRHMRTLLLYASITFALPLATLFLSLCSFTFQYISDNSIMKNSTFNSGGHALLIHMRMLVSDSRGGGDHVPPTRLEQQNNVKNESTDAIYYLVSVRWAKNGLCALHDAPRGYAQGFVAAIAWTNQNNLRGIFLVRTPACLHEN